MITHYDLYKVRLMEFFQVMQNVKTFLDKEDATDLGIAEAKNQFSEKLEVLDIKLKPLVKSIHTQQLNELDARRNELLVGLLAHCRAFLLFPEETKVQAAQKLLNTIEKYGKEIQNKPLLEKTAIIYNIEKDFSESSHQQALRTMGGEKWVTELGIANSKFATLHTERTQQQGEIETGATQQARKELALAFKHLVKTINALAYLNGTTKYQTLANSINQEIKQAKQ